MSFTAEQTATVRAQIAAAGLADPTLAQAANGALGGMESDAYLAQWLNAAAPGEAWKNYVTLGEAQAVMDWTEFVRRTPAEQATWAALWQGGSCDMGQIRVRSAVDVVFAGEGTDSAALRAALLAAFRRSLTRLEKMLASLGADGYYTLTHSGLIDPGSAGQLVRG